ncbi:MAG: FAD-dependent oxidoreductase [Lishizhenia sp.]
MNETRIGIVGAGLTGLIAAKVLSSNNFNVTVFEKSETPGGRMVTEVVDGWNLDVGFQVLLSAYPVLNRCVDWTNLEVHKLDSAATVFMNNKRMVVGDPFRTKGVFLQTLFSSVGSIRDKYLVFKLKRYVDKLDTRSIFTLSNASTLSFLQDFGFSHKIISRFFKPFFGGIFLEKELLTSNRMFLFIFKMFADGDALLPIEGIGALGKQLADDMPDVNFNYNSSVQHMDLSKASLSLENGAVSNFDYIINTIPNHGELESVSKWNGCYNLYFEHNSPAILKEVRIGLNANEGRLINNLFYPSSIQCPTDKEGKNLLSITVLDAKGLSQNELINRVERELIEDFNLKECHLKLLKVYHLPYSLPNIKAPKYASSFESHEGNVFHVGDFSANGSQNAACAIGEAVAKEILNRVKNKNSL